MAKEYIEREAAIESMYKDAEAYPGHIFWTTQNEALHSIPAADVRPVVKAKFGDDWETGCSTCSACGESYLWEDYDGVGEWNYCPNCGADMREES